MIKITKENYKEIIKTWPGCENEFIFSEDEFLGNTIQQHAFSNNFLVKIEHFQGKLYIVKLIKTLN